MDVRALTHVLANPEHLPYQSKLQDIGFIVPGHYHEGSCWISHFMHEWKLAIGVSEAGGKKEAVDAVMKRSRCQRT